MHSVLTWALECPSQGDFFALRYFKRAMCVPDKKVKENGVSNFSGNSIDCSQGWCSVGISLRLGLK